MLLPHPPHSSPGTQPLPGGESVDWEGEEEGLTLPMVPHFHCISCLTVTDPESAAGGGMGQNARELPAQRFRKVSIQISQGRHRVKHRNLVQAAARLQTGQPGSPHPEISPGGGSPGPEPWDAGSNKARPLQGGRGQSACQISAKGPGQP